jgi:hypothetical protein
MSDPREVDWAAKAAAVAVVPIVVEAVAAKMAGVIVTPTDHLRQDWGRWDTANATSAARRATGPAIVGLR